MKKESVATHLAKIIQTNINGEEVDTRYTSRFNRKVFMTNNRMHWYLLTQEEYAQSRHTGSDMNINAEVYLESTQ